MTTRCAVVLISTLMVAATGCAGGGESTDEVSSGEAEVRASGAMLTQVEEKAVLARIDQVCGDSWCEGDFDFKFRKLECRTSTHECRFEFDFLHRVYSADGDQVLAKLPIPTTCTFKNIASRNDVMTMEAGRATYTEKLYDLVNDCISENEGRAAREAERLEAEFRARR